MSATSDRPRAVRATLRFLALALLALAGTATAQTPPYFINAFGSPTTATVQEGQTFTPVVRVTDGSGTPVQGWTVDWTVAPSGSVAATTTTSFAAPAVLGGVTSNSFTNYIAGTYTISASTFDGMVIILKDGSRVTPAGTAGPVTFTVNVENVGMAVVDPPGGKDVILTNAVRALQVYWGSASLPTAGTTINWSIVSEPSAGAGTLGTPTVTNTSGMSTVDFSGAVPGDYTIRAQEFGCTWCGPTSQDFIITVVDPAADLHAIISDTPDPVDLDQTISYDIGIGNNGPQAATSASWSIATPADTSFESFTTAGSWSCSTPAAGASGTITCTQASLPSGAADLFTLVVRVTGNPLAGSLIAASVNVTSATADSDSTNNDASTDTTVAPAYAIFFHKTLVGSDDNDSSGNVSVGDTLHYSVLVNNPGNVALTNVVVTDDLIGGPLTCPTLAVGANCELTGDYVVTPADETAGQVVNTGSATSTEFPTPSEETVTTPVVPVPAPGMTVATVLTANADGDGSGDVTLGDVLTFQVTATNTGNVPLNNVAVRADRFANFGNCLTVAVGGTCGVTGTYTVTGADVTATQFDTTGSADSFEFPTAITDTLTTPVFFHPAPSMTLVKALASSTDTDGSNSVTEGDVLHYTVTATNTGNVTLLNLQIDDAPLTPSFTVCSAVSPGGTCVLSGDYTVVQADAALGQVDNTATAISAELPTPLSSNTLTTVVAGTPAMSVLKVLTGNFDMDNSGDISVTDELYYDVTATNTGTTTLNNVVVSDDHYGGTQTCATLAPSGTCVLNVIYTVQAADAIAGEVVNVGSAVSAEFPTPITYSVATAVAAGPPVLNIVSGDNSAGYGGQSATLVVSLLDAQGNPTLAGQTITWTGANNATSVVQPDGTSSNTVSFNGTTGFITVTAAYLPASLEVQFNVQSVSAALLVNAGNNQTAPAGTVVPNPLEVLATDDNSPVSTSIVWTVTGDATVSPTTGGTDIDGLASTVVTLGPSQGPVFVQAQRPDSGETAVFTVTAAAPVRTLLIHDGNNQSAPPGATLPFNLVVEAQDNGVGVDGAIINFSVIGGSDAQVGTCCGTTAGGGFAGTSLTLRTTPGPVQVRAERADDPTVFVVFDATAIARGLSYISGDNQSALTGTPMTDLLVVQTLLGGAPEAGITIDWTSTGIDATLTPVDNPTDANGNGTAQLTCGATAETFNVVAARFDDPSLSVTFTATCTTTRTLVIASGNNQSGAPGAALPTGLVVQAQDNGVGADGVTINYTVIGGSDAQLAPASATTAGGGFAGTTLTLRSSAGPVQVRAERADDPTVFVVFDATALARGLVYVSGNNQAASANQFLPMFLSVESLLGGVPQAGVDILWTTTATAAGFTQFNNPTDANGLGSAQVQCGAMAETFTVTAARADNPTVRVDFTATCTLTRTLVLYDGNLQSGPPGATLPVNLVVVASDDGIGVDGVAINYSVVGGSDAQVGAGTVATSGGGFAGTTLTLRSTAGPVQVRAERADDPSVFVLFDATALARGLSYVSGDNQSAATGTPMSGLLAVQTLLGGAPEPGITIDWTSTGTDATLVPVDNPTDASGNGTAQLTCGATAESFTVVAARLDDPTLSVSFTATCTLTRTLVIASGNNQSGAPGATLPQGLGVQAQDNGVGADGVTINYSVIGGSDAQVGATSATTAGGGFAGTTLTLRSSAGPVQVRAERADDPSVFVVFDATALARGLVYVSGNNQSAPTGTALAALLAVQGQLGGLAEPGVVLAWSTTSTSAAVVPVANPTDGSGNGTAQVTCGAIAETFTVTAARVDNPTIQVGFTASCTLTRTLVITGGNGQSGLIGSTSPQWLQVQALDNGVGADGVSIAWTLVQGDASFAPNMVTSGGGFASNTLTFGNSPGAVQVRAERADDPGVFVLFDLVATQAQLTIVSGDPQSGFAGLPGEAGLVVELRDGTPANNPIMNATISWVTVSGDAQPEVPTALTSINGQAGVAFYYRNPGPSVIQARYGALAVDFHVLAQQRGLVLLSGSGQTAPVGAALADLLVARAELDGAGQPGVALAWDVSSGDATIVPVTDPTDVSGNGSAQLTCGANAGNVQARAIRIDDPSLVATFTATCAVARTLSIVSGDAQSGLAATTADAPLVVRLADHLGNPVAGEPITWTVSGAGQLASFDTTTRADGTAHAQLVYGPGAGAISVGASVPASVPLLSANFTATSLTPAIGIGSGDNQVGPVNTSLPLPLTVVVGEVVVAAMKGRVGADALNGVPVTFAVTSGGGSVSSTTVMTDATGQAATQFTLGPVEGAQTVTATVAGGASVTFTATATVARTLVLVSGDGQSAAPGSVLPAPLVVHAQDDGADVAGVGITWTVTGPATITPSGATDSAGLASATVTLGGTPGVVSIRAARADDPTVFVDFEANTAKIQDIPGLTPEERELAIVIDETCATLAGMASLTPPQADFLARCQELTDGSVIDPGAVTDALDELLPGLALAMQEASFNAAQAQFQNLKARIAALRSGTQGSSFQGLALNNSSGTVSLGSLGAALTGDGDEPAKPSGGTGSDFQRWGFFASGTIGRGEAEAGSTRPAYDYDINGLTVGLDYRYSDNFIFGGALGYTRQDSELRDQPGNMDMSGWSASGYATWYRDNSWYTDAVLTYGHNSFDLLRSITYSVPLPGGGISSISQTARSNSDGTLLEGAFTFGRDFQAGGWSIGPYGRLLYTKLEFDRIVDDMDPGAGSGLGLEIDARSLTSVASEIGAKFTFAHSTDWGVVTPHLQLEWEHEFKDDPRALTARFLADPNGTPFSLSGEDIDTDFFRMSLGLSIIMQRGRSGFVIYERTVGRDGFFQDNLGFGVRIEF